MSLNTWFHFTGVAGGRIVSGAGPSRWLLEGHVLRFAPGTQHIVGLTVLGAQRIFDRDGELRVTIPESVKASADDLASALAAD